MSVQKLLELATLVLHGLLHEVRPDVADSKVGHVHLHQVQHRENLPGRRGREDKAGVEQVGSSSRFHLLTDLSRGTISVISFSLLMSSSLQGAHSEPMVQIMNCESRPMSSTPFSACCWIKGRSRASSIREPRRLWSAGRKDSSVWTTAVTTVTPERTSKASCRSCFWRSEPA